MTDAAASLFLGYTECSALIFASISRPPAPLEIRIVQKALNGQRHCGRHADRRMKFCVICSVPRDYKVVLIATNPIFRIHRSLYVNGFRDGTRRSNADNAGTSTRRKKRANAYKRRNVGHQRGWLVGCCKGISMVSGDNPGHADTVAAATVLPAHFVRLA